MPAGMQSRCSTALRMHKNDECRHGDQSKLSAFQAVHQQGDIRHGRQAAHPCLHQLLMHAPAHSGSAPVVAVQQDIAY